MVYDVLLFGKKSVPLDNRSAMAASRARLHSRVRELADDLEFRRRWKHVEKVELMTDAAIFRLDDGSKWYLNIR